MSRRSGLAGVAVVLAGPLLFGGCAGFMAGIPGVKRLGVDPQVRAIEPALASDVARRLPGASYSTIYANGMVWFGHNFVTAEIGDLDVYDNGEGTSFGVAFGDSENLKRFFEIGYERTGGHEATSGPASTASHERIYAGVRRYILPVAKETGGRVVPFVVGGVTFQTIKGSGAVATSSGNVETAQGAGVYIGAGFEFKLGASSQVAIAVDVRGSFITYDGAPEGTGRQSAVGSAIALIFHF